MISSRRARPFAIALLAVTPLLAACSQIDPNDPVYGPGVPQRSAATTAPSAAPATPQKPTPSAVEPSAAVTAADGTVTCSYPTFGASVRPVKAPTAAGVKATGTATFTLKFAAGDVTFTADRSVTPCTVNSFASLASQSFFDDTQCHRLVDSGPYLLQCGDPSETGRGGPGYLVADEIAPGASYPAGTVAMANTGAKNHNGSQFFIVYQDSDIPANYTVLGHLTGNSLAVVQQLAAQGSDGSDPNGGGKPKADTTINDVSEQDS